MGAAVHHPIYPERSKNGGSIWVAPPPTVRCHRHPVRWPTSRWLTVGVRPLGALSPLVRWPHCPIRCPRRNSSKEVTILFACVAINRGCGRPWSLSWHLLHLCTPFGSWATHSTHLFTWFHHLKWDWRASSALHWVASSCDTSWKLWAGCCWWSLTPVFTINISPKSRENHHHMWRFMFKFHLVPLVFVELFVCRKYDKNMPKWWQTWTCGPSGCDRRPRAHRQGPLIPARASPYPTWC
jgi:hypothetical protein